jgi:uncharacterized protein YqjF (DUF2071 family)
MMTMTSPDAILSENAHRPWPLPDSPWVMFQQWSDLLFAHWAVNPDVLRPLVPRELELDLFEGKAWVAVTPFRMTDLWMRSLPRIPGANHFLEMNFRTYVRFGVARGVREHAPPLNVRDDQESKPGVYFFSLDASNLPAVLGARIGLGLPYYWADMTAEAVGGGGEEIHYTSRRRQGGAEVDVQYGPMGDLIGRKTDRERFLTERYCLYEVRAGLVMRTQIHHIPWPLHKARATFTTNTVGRRVNLPLSRRPDLLHFCRQLDVLVYPPENVWSL